MPLGFLRWPVVLAIVVLFVAAALRGAKGFAWTLAVLRLDLRLRPLRLRDADPVLGRAASTWSIATLALTAYVTSSATRREEFLAPLVRARRRAAPAAAARRGARAAAGARRRRRLAAAASETLEAPAFGRTVHPAPPDTIPLGDKTIDLITGRQPVPRARDEGPGGFQGPRRERPQDLLPQLPLLPRRRDGAATACSRTA